MCAECGQNLQGRADKRFCDDQCRSQFNNRNNSTFKNLYRRVEYALRKNHTILQGLNPQGTAVVTRRQLTRQGFDFEYITSQYNSHSGQVFYAVYDQGYRFIDQDQVVLELSLNHEPPLPLPGTLRSTG
jgi:hypothetical protein